jgi:hypothetical protein
MDPKLLPSLKEVLRETADERNPDDEPGVDAPASVSCDAVALDGEAFFVIYQGPDLIVIPFSAIAKFMDDTRRMMGEAAVQFSEIEG